MSKITNKDAKMVGKRIGMIIKKKPKFFVIVMIVNFLFFYYLFKQLL